MRAASLAVALAACLACSARSDPAAEGSGERRHLGDAPAWAGDTTGLNNAATRQRIHDEYKRHAETASNLWNMRRWKQAVKKSEDPELSDHLRRWMYAHHVPAKYLDPDVPTTAYVPFTPGVYLDPMPGAGINAIGGVGGVPLFNQEQALADHHRLLHEYSTSPFNYVMWLRRMLAANPSTAALASAVGAGAEALDPYHFQTSAYLPSGWGPAAQGLRNKVALATTTAVADGLPTPASYRQFDMQAPAYSQADPFSGRMASIHPWSPAAPRSDQPTPHVDANGATILLQQAGKGARRNPRAAEATAAAAAAPSSLDSAMGLPPSPARKAASGGSGSPARFAEVHSQSKASAGLGAGLGAAAEAKAHAHAGHRRLHSTAARRLLAKAGAKDDTTTTTKDGPPAPVVIHQYGVPPGSGVPAGTSVLTTTAGFPGHTPTTLMPFQTGNLPSGLPTPQADMFADPKTNFMIPPSNGPGDGMTATFGNWNPSGVHPQGVPIYPPDASSPFVLAATSGLHAPQDVVVGAPPLSIYHGDTASAIAAHAKATGGKLDPPPPQLLSPQLYPARSPDHTGSDRLFGAAPPTSSALLPHTAGTYGSHADGHALYGVPSDGHSSSHTYESQGGITGHSYHNSASGGYPYNTVGRHASYTDLVTATTGKRPTPAEASKYAPEEDRLATSYGMEPHHSGYPAGSSVDPRANGGVGLGGGHPARVDAAPSRHDEADAEGASDDDGYTEEDSSSEGGLSDSAHDGSLAGSTSGSGQDLGQTLQVLSNAVAALAQSQSSMWSHVRASDMESTVARAAAQGVQAGLAGGRGGGSSTLGSGVPRGAGHLGDEVGLDWAGQSKGEDGGEDEDDDGEEYGQDEEGFGTRGGDVGSTPRDGAPRTSWRLRRSQSEGVQEGEQQGGRSHGGHVTRYRDTASVDEDAQRFRSKAGSAWSSHPAHGSMYRAHAGPAGHFVDHTHAPFGHSGMHRHSGYRHPAVGHFHPHGPHGGPGAAFDGAHALGMHHFPHGSVPAHQRHVGATGHHAALSWLSPAAREHAARTASAAGRSGVHNGQPLMPHATSGIPRLGPNAGMPVSSVHHSHALPGHGVSAGTAGFHPGVANTLPHSVGGGDAESAAALHAAAPQPLSDPQDSLVLDAHVDELPDETKRAMLKAHNDARNARFAQAKAHAGAASKAHAGAASKAHAGAASKAHAGAAAGVSSRHAALRRAGSTLANPLFDDPHTAATIAASEDSPFGMRGTDVEPAGHRPSSAESGLRSIRARISGRLEGDDDGSHLNDALKARVARFLAKRKGSSLGEPVADQLKAAHRADDPVLRALRHQAKAHVQAPPDLFLQTGAGSGAGAGHVAAASAAPAPTKAQASAKALAQASSPAKPLAAASSLPAAPSQRAPKPSPAALPAAQAAASPAAAVPSRNKAAAIAAEARGRTAAAVHSAASAATPMPRFRGLAKAAERLTHAAAAHVSRHTRPSGLRSTTSQADIQAARNRLGTASEQPGDVAIIQQAETDLMLGLSVQRQGSPTEPKGPVKGQPKEPVPSQPPQLRTLDRLGLKAMTDTGRLSAHLLFNANPATPAKDSRREDYAKMVFAGVEDPPGSAGRSPDLTRHLAHGALELFSGDVEGEVPLAVPPPAPIRMEAAEAVMANAVDKSGVKRVSDPLPVEGFPLPRLEDSPYSPDVTKAEFKLFSERYGLAQGGLDNPIEQLLGPGAANARQFYSQRDINGGPFSPVQGQAFVQLRGSARSKQAPRQEAAE
ncbi:hypothetical protein FNF27_06718 [Cafeteria roenbergensis]|uniref:DRBM domain-containing protein n=1 Tax=Cafeteria roenbergensis TaxID=33653 RepID=A0A5A8DXE1_CAFRO|nr:hypothetical protein FNF27_06718 [Cafeteria roenbergensis]